MLYIQIPLYLNLAETQLIEEPENKLTMLKNVFGVNVLDGIVSSMNVRVAVLERGLENKRRRVTITSGRAVVRARISTDTIHVSNVGVLC